MSCHLTELLSDTHISHVYTITTLTAFYIMHADPYTILYCIHTLKPKETIKQKCYLNNALNNDAEHSSDSMLLAPCFPAVERPFFPTIKEKQEMLLPSSNEALSERN